MSGNYNIAFDSANEISFIAVDSKSIYFKICTQV